MIQSTQCSRCKHAFIRISKWNYTVVWFTTARHSTPLCTDGLPSAIQGRNLKYGWRATHHPALLSRSMSRYQASHAIRPHTGLQD